VAEPGRSLEGRRILVVGASVAIGHSVAAEATRRGGRVAVAARRVDPLEQLVTDGGAEVAFPCDVTEAGACEALVERTVDALGGLDSVVYTPGLYLLDDLDDLDRESWRRTFDVNLIGAAVTTAAAMPHLVASGQGKVVYFTSVNTFVTPHWAGMAAYSIAKVALDRMAECWRYEHPDVGFTLVQVGSTEGTDGPVIAGWTEEKVARFAPRWAHLLEPELQDRSVVAHAVADALSSPSVIERLSVVPRRAIGEARADLSSERFMSGGHTSSEASGEDLGVAEAESQPDGHTAHLGQPRSAAR
jgi:NAD(P)-dependent dehydrogenase (short-subunit alcohol dehydrogenase family)